MARARINFTALLQQRESDKKRRLRRAATIIMASWKQAARQELGRSKTGYIRALARRIGKDSASVLLTGTVPNIVEQGMGPGGVGTYGPYDVGKFILRQGTANLRHTADGRRYVNVPFHHSSSDIKALGGADAYREVRNLDPSKTRPDPQGRTILGGVPVSTKWGERLEAGWTGNQRPTAVTFTHEGKQYTQHAHATDYLDSMVRMKKVYAAPRGQGTNTTFRRIIQGGKPWISRGVKPRHLAVIAQRLVTARMREILE